MDIDPRLTGESRSPTAAAPQPQASSPEKGAAGRAAASDSEQNRTASQPNAASAATPYASVSVFSPETPPSAGGAESGSNGHHGGLDGSPTATPVDPNGAAGDPKKPRACEACRGLKVRCEPDPANPDGPCKRCAKAGRSCVVTQPTRKRQKKTDSRVAELEKKIDALTASLQATRGGAGVAGGAPGPSVGGTSSTLAGVGGSIGLLSSIARPAVDEGGGYGASSYGNSGGIGRDWGATPSRETPQQPRVQQSFAMDSDKQAYPPPMVMAGQKRKFTETRETAGDDVREPPAAHHPAIQSTVGAEYSDVIDRGVLSMEKATELFARYTRQMVQHLPGVVFPEGTTAAEVRKSKPILFLAILAASSSEIPDIQRTLVREMMQIFAEKVIITGEKSLELVQALHVAVIWYWPPEHFEELKFYQLVHIAAVMAIDIGLGRKKAGGRLRRHIPYTWRDHPFKKHPPPDPTSIEARRAWLTCYFLSSNTSMALHRPILIRWTPFMTECVDILESSPEAAPSDKYLCHLVWTHRLAEEVGIQFSMDDPSSNINIADARTQYALKGFERDLEKYRSTIPTDMLQPALLLSFHVLSLYMHEIALQTDKVDDFKPPYTGDSLREALATDAPLTPAHISALSACLTAIDGIFDTFLNMDVHNIRCLPVFNFVRVAYAVVVLIKMYFAASSPKSELGKVINKDNMKVEHHLESLLEKFRATAADDKSRPAAKFLVVLVMLRSWFHRQSQPGAKGRRRGEGAANDLPVCPGLSDAMSHLQPRPVGDKEAEPVAQPSQQQAQADYSATANTPLQLLSEIATNDPAANGSPGTGRPAVNLASLAPWAVGTQPTQPFVYDASPGDGTTPNAAPGGGTGASGSADGDVANPTRGMLDQGPPMPWLNSAFTNDYDYGPLGDGFQQAMDLTLAGLTDGVSGPGIETGMRYVMQEPWFGEVIGNVPGGNMWPF